MPKTLPTTIHEGLPITALAPMQDITDLSFMNALGKFGPPDYFVTEFFRVTPHSILEKHIVQSITEQQTNRPVFAQFIGEAIPDIKRTVKNLLELPVAGIDINMGCPAPKIYKKNVGGGLLRNPGKIKELFSALREEIPGLFTVKMRIGFEDARHFDEILDLINEFDVDLLSLHGRTVKEMYRGDVHYDQIKHAVERVNCPVLANGNISSAEKAWKVLEETGAAGVMIGRSAIRNPWIFRQCQELFLQKRDAKTEVYRPRLKNVREYVDVLWKMTDSGAPELMHLGKMKKRLNFIGQSIDPNSAFLQKMRHSLTAEDLFKTCDEFMVENGNAEKLFSNEPFPGVIARPNAEDSKGCS